MHGIYRSRKSIGRKWQTEKCKKVAATGFASFYALLVSLGLNDEQITTIMWDIDLKFLLEESNSSNLTSAVKTIIGLKEVFWNQLWSNDFRDCKYILDRILGRGDVTFAELQDYRQKIMHSCNERE